jgi:hypothetical protein
VSLFHRGEERWPSGAIIPSIIGIFSREHPSLSLSRAAARRLFPWNAAAREVIAGEGGGRKAQIAMLQAGELDLAAGAGCQLLR